MAYGGHYRGRPCNPHQECTRKWLGSRVIMIFAYNTRNTWIFAFYKQRHFMWIYIRFCLLSAKKREVFQNVRQEIVKQRANLDCFFIWHWSTIDRNWHCCGHATIAATFSPTSEQPAIGLWQTTILRRLRSNAASSSPSPVSFTLNLTLTSPQSTSFLSDSEDGRQTNLLSTETRSSPLAQAARRPHILSLDPIPNQSISIYRFHWRYLHGQNGAQCLTLFHFFLCFGGPHSRLNQIFAHFWQATFTPSVKTFGEGVRRPLNRDPFCHFHLIEPKFCKHIPCAPDGHLSKNGRGSKQKPNKAMMTQMKMELSTSSITTNTCGFLTANASVSMSQFDWLMVKVYT